MNFVLKSYYLLLISYPRDCFNAITLNFTDIHMSGVCSVVASANESTEKSRYLDIQTSFKKTVEAQQIQNSNKVLVSECY